MIIVFKKVIFTIFLFVFSLSCFAADKIAFENAWVREAPPMARNLAAYAEVKNIANETLKIVSLSSPMFEKVEMHVISLKNGMMRMKQVESMSLVSGESVVFEPGGKHFMLIKPKQRITAGLRVPITLKLQSGDVITVEMEVRK